MAERGVAIGVPELVIILGLLLVFISGFISGGEKPESAEGIPLLYQEVGTIGGTGFSYKHISLGPGFTLSKGVEGTPIVSQPGPVEIANGIFTKEEHVIEFSVPNIGEINTATFEAEVVETNSYAPLIIYLNGKEVWKGVAKVGDIIEFRLPVEQLKERNTLRITCGSSGWRLWAPTYYLLRNIKITETLSTGEKVDLSFKVSPTDLANLYSVNFYSPIVPKIPGELIMILNGEKVVYRGAPNQRIFVVSFSSGIKEENTLEIKLLSDGQYEFRNPEIVLVVQKNATAGVSYPLTIPDEYLAAMRSGKLYGEIEIYVNRAGETPLKVILSSEKENVVYEGIPSPGKLVIRFTGYDVGRENSIILRSGSVYDIKYIKVRLVKK